jgi:hypothetical protein
VPMVPQPASSESTASNASRRRTIV